MISMSSSPRYDWSRFGPVFRHVWEMNVSAVTFVLDPVRPRIVLDGKEKNVVFNAEGYELREPDDFTAVHSGLPLVNTGLDEDAPSPRKPTANVHVRRNLSRDNEPESAPNDTEITSRQQTAEMCENRVKCEKGSCGRAFSRPELDSRNERGEPRGLTRKQQAELQEGRSSHKQTAVVNGRPVIEMAIDTNESPVSMDSVRSEISVSPEPLPALPPVEARVLPEAIVRNEVLEAEALQDIDAIDLTLESDEDATASSVSMHGESSKDMSDNACAVDGQYGSHSGITGKLPASLLFGQTDSILNEPRVVGQISPPPAVQDVAMNQLPAEIDFLTPTQYWNVCEILKRGRNGSAISTQQDNPQNTGDALMLQEWIEKNHALSNDPAQASNVRYRAAYRLGWAFTIAWPDPVLKGVICDICEKVIGKGYEHEPRLHATAVRALFDSFDDAAYDCLAFLKYEDYVALNVEQQMQLTNYILAVRTEGRQLPSVGRAQD